jgi:hypothetical protein
MGSYKGHDLGFVVWIAPWKMILSGIIFQSAWIPLNRRAASSLVLEENR